MVVACAGPNTVARRHTRLSRALRSSPRKRMQPAPMPKRGLTHSHIPGREDSTNNVCRGEDSAGSVCRGGMCPCEWRARVEFTPASTVDSGSCCACSGPNETARGEGVGGKIAGVCGYEGRAGSPPHWSCLETLSCSGRRDGVVGMGAWAGQLLPLPPMPDDRRRWPAIQLQSPLSSSLLYDPTTGTHGGQDRTAS